MKILLLFVAACILSTGAFAQENSKCDLSKYKAIAISHFIPRSVIKRVKPEFPGAAAAVNAGGKVLVTIIVDRKGNVIDSCVIKGHPLFAVAANSAAMQWKFRKHFGLSAKFKQRIKFLRDTLIFNFARKYS